MPSSAPGDLKSVVEEFESGGFWSCRQLNKWVLAIVTLAFGISLGADVIFQISVSSEVPVSLLVAGVLAVGCVVLLWACVTYAVPAGLAILALGLFNDGTVYSVILALLLTALAAQTSTRRFRHGTVALMVVWAGLYGATVEDPAWGVALFVGLALALLAAYGIGTAFRRATSARHQSRRDLGEMEQHHRESVAAERKSIARDLHDMVAHDITIIAMQSRAAQMKNTEGAYREAVEIIGDSSRAALNDLRRMLSLLQDDDTASHEGDHYGTASELDLRQGCEFFAQRLQGLGITVNTTIAGDLETVSRSVSAALYRMLQECTTNVAKYAGDSATCWVEITVGEDHVQMRVTNTLEAQVAGHHRADGARSGWNHSGAGLIGVRDRAAAFGGVATAGDHGSVWTVEVSNMKKA